MGFSAMSQRIIAENRESLQITVEGMEQTMEYEVI